MREEDYTQWDTTLLEDEYHDLQKQRDKILDIYDVEFGETLAEVEHRIRQVKSELDRRKQQQ